MSISQCWTVVGDDGDDSNRDAHDDIFSESEVQCDVH